MVNEVPDSLSRKRTAQMLRALTSQVKMLKAQIEQAQHFVRTPRVRRRD